MAQIQNILKEMKEKVLFETQWKNDYFDKIRLSEAGTPISKQIRAND